MAAFHSGETADLGGCLGSDAQTVTALAPGQPRRAASTAMVSQSGAQTQQLDAGPGLAPLLWQHLPCATLAPSASVSASGEEGHKLEISIMHRPHQHPGLISLFSFRSAERTLLPPGGMQTWDCRLVALEAPEKKPLHTSPSSALEARTQARRGSVACPCATHHSPPGQPLPRHRSAS